MKYQLVSSGYLKAESEEKESIARIQRITKLSEDQIQKTLLNGKPKILRSSDNKEKIKKATLALHKAGLEVKIKVCPPSTGSVRQVDGPDAIAPCNEKGLAEKERIDTLPSFAAPAKKKKTKQ
ncbi:MAG: hypothetical protein D3909_05095, partial [Candidatus Electrothrix sp. ATG1]|nr:hypothetical protein [Candidatus Electrothrix sp. ATG1]